MSLESSFRLEFARHFVCENNQFGISVHQSRHQRSRMWRCGPKHDPGVIVDGMDIALAVYEACREAWRARQGQGPTSSVQDLSVHGSPREIGTVYRDKEEVEAWKEKCPIKCFADKLIAEGVMTAAEFEALDKRVTEQMLAAVKFAERAPGPSRKKAMEGLYVW